MQPNFYLAGVRGFFLWTLSFADDNCWIILCFIHASLRSIITKLNIIARVCFCCQTDFFYSPFSSSSSAFPLSWACAALSGCATASGVWYQRRMKLHDWSQFSHEKRTLSPQVRPVWSRHLVTAQRPLSDCLLANSGLAYVHGGMRVHVCVVLPPPGIPFLFPTDFRAALKFFLQSSEEGERDEWKGEDVCVGCGWGQRQRIVEGEEWKMLLLLLFFTPALSACRHFCQMVFLQEVGCVGGVGKNWEFDYIILDICNHSLMNNKTW